MQAIHLPLSPVTYRAPPSRNLQKHLLRFIKHKLKREPDEVVIVRDGKHLTLAQVR
jgi:hypothetical protein